MLKIGRIFGGLASAIAALVILGVAGCEARKAYFDSQVRSMCEKDGGVVVFEKVKLSAAAAKKLGTVNGNISIATKDLADPDAPVFAEDHRSEIRSYNPEIFRNEERLIRREDGRLFARVVRYTRRGGDFPFLAHPSYFSCPDEATIFRARDQAFQIERDPK